jgi:predicted PurR-regulated permease PerM
MTRDRTFTSRVFALVFAGALAWALFRVFQPFLSAILWALLLAFLLFPLNRRLRARFKGRKGAAALALTAAAIAGIVVPAALLVVAFIDQGSQLLSKLSAMADQYKIARPSDILQIPVIDRILHNIQEKVPVTTDQFQKWLVDLLRRTVQLLIAGSRGVFMGALDVVFGAVLTLFLLYFFIRDGDELAERAIRLLPADETLKRRLAAHLSSVTRAVVLGALLTALVQGALLGAAFGVSGLPSPVVFGVLAAVCSLIPFGGTALVWVPGALLLGAQGHWGRAVFLAVWGALVVSTADNILRPLLISGQARISTLAVFLGVLGGLAAFGMIGLFLGPVLIALALELVRFAEQDREARDAPAPSG